MNQLDLLFKKGLLLLFYNLTQLGFLDNMHLPVCGLSSVYLSPKSQGYLTLGLSANSQ